MLAMTYALLLAAPSADPEPPVKLKPPVVKFIGLKEGRLVFEVNNPNRAPVPYLGYGPESGDPPRKQGAISPLYKVELCRGGAWKDNRAGWCGTGVGAVSLAGKGKVTFTADLPDGQWEGVRVGLVWYATADRKGAAATAWSDAVTRQAATPAKAP